MRGRSQCLCVLDSGLFNIDARQSTSRGGGNRNRWTARPASDIEQFAVRTLLDKSDYFALFAKRPPSLLAEVLAIGLESDLGCESTAEARILSAIEGEIARVG
ncbi:hypothetical protein D9M70_560840 [compost metagenome]